MSGPKVVEVGGPDEPVRHLFIGLVSVRVDVTSVSGDVTLLRAAAPADPDATVTP